MWFGFNEINNRCTSIMVSESLTQGFDFYVFTVYSFGFVMVIVVKPVYFVSCVLYYWRFCICHLAFQFLVSLQMIIPFCVRPSKSCLCFVFCLCVAWVSLSGSQCQSCLHFYLLSLSVLMSWSVSLCFFTFLSQSQACDSVPVFCYFLFYFGSLRENCFAFLVSFVCD